MLAERIAGLCEAVRHCGDDSPLMDLLVANLPILLAFLHVSPALPFDVTLPYGTYGAGCTLRTTAGVCAAMRDCEDPYRVAAGERGAARQSGRVECDERDEGERDHEGECEIDA